MSATLKPYEKAGRLFRLLGWLQLIAGGCLGLAILIPAMAQGKGQSGMAGPVAVGAALIFMLLASVFMLYLGAAVKRHENWGRTAGIVLAIIQLFGFPIGTILGGYILWCLIKGWDVIVDGDKV